MRVKYAHCLWSPQWRAGSGRLRDLMHCAHRVAHPESHIGGLNWAWAWCLRVAAERSGSARIQYSGDRLQQPDRNSSSNRGLKRGDGQRGEIRTRRAKHRLSVANRHHRVQHPRIAVCGNRKRAHWRTQAIAHHWRQPTSRAAGSFGESDFAIDDREHARRRLAFRRTTADWPPAWRAFCRQAVWKRALWWTKHGCSNSSTTISSKPGQTKTRDASLGMLSTGKPVRN